MSGQEFSATVSNEENANTASDALVAALNVCIKRGLDPYQILCGYLYAGLRFIESAPHDGRPDWLVLLHRGLYGGVEGIKSYWQWEEGGEEEDDAG